MLNMIFRRMLGAAIALGVVVGAQFVLTEVAQAQSSVVYLPIAPSGVEEVAEVRAAGSLLGPCCGPLSSADDGESHYDRMPKVYVSFDIGSGDSYKRHVSVWQKDEGKWLGWYARIPCRRAIPTVDCVGSIDTLILNHRYTDKEKDIEFWGEPAIIDLLPGPNMVHTWYLNDFIEHTVAVQDNKIIQTIVRNSGTYQREVPTSGREVLWSDSRTTGWTWQR